VTVDRPQRTNRYSVRPALWSRDREQIVALWRGNLGNPPLAESKFQWFYESSATGAPLVLLLEHTEDGLVGVAAVGPRTFFRDGQALRAGLLVDMAVSAGHRTLFPALMLQKALREHGLRELQFLYGFPNPRAAPVLQRGYRKLATMTRYVRVVRTADYLVERLPRLLASPLGALLDLANGAALRLASRGVKLEWSAFAGAWEASGDDERACRASLLYGARSEQFLRWRFTESRGRSYSLVRASAVDSGDRIGHWVIEIADRTLFVRDCAAATFDHPLAAAAWNALFAEAGRRKLRSVSFSCVVPPYFLRILRDLLMRPRGERPVFFAERAATAPVVAADAIYLTDADEDE
jgi:hypothetical protein